MFIACVRQADDTNRVAAAIATDKRSKGEKRK
jgi:hypothetical protein